MMLKNYIYYENKKLLNSNALFAMAGMTKNRIGTQRGEIISEGAFLFSYK